MTMGIGRPEEPTHQPERVVVGHCPACRRVLVLFNNHEIWALVRCECGWAGATTDIVNRTRYENGGQVDDLWGTGPRGFGEGATPRAQCQVCGARAAGSFCAACGAEQLG